MFLSTYKIPAYSNADTKITVTKKTKKGQTTFSILTIKSTANKRIYMSLLMKMSHLYKVKHYLAQDVPLVNVFSVHYKVLTKPKFMEGCHDNVSPKSIDLHHTTNT